VNETSAEERLLAHLGTLREHPPEADEQLTAAVIGTVQWQTTVRPYLSVAGVFATALATCASVLIEGGRAR
jgi:hypothetical protein